MGLLFLTPQLWYEGKKDTCIKTFILFYTQHVQVNISINYMAPVKIEKKNIKESTASDCIEIQNNTSLISPQNIQ